MNSTHGATSLGMQPRFKVIEYKPSKGNVDNNMCYTYINAADRQYTRSIRTSVEQRTKNERAYSLTLRRFHVEQCVQILECISIDTNTAHPTSRRCCIHLFLRKQWQSIDVRHRSSWRSVDFLQMYVFRI